MEEKEKLIEYVLKMVDAKREDLEYMSSCFTVKHVRKKQFLLQPDYVARHRNFVIEGSFRSFITDEKGVDHTISFAIANWWITDYNSYIYRQNGCMFVEALEESTVLQLEYEKEKQLKKEKHIFETIFRLLAEKGTAFYQKRLISNLTLTAEERYEEFVEKYPQIVQRVPQYAIASYLGMTSEFLSRIRNKKMGKKID